MKSGHALSRIILVPGLVVATAVIMLWPRVPPPRAQSPAAQPPSTRGRDVYMNVTGGGGKKLNIVIPTFTVVSGTDSTGMAKLLATVAANDLNFSGLFEAAAATDLTPTNNPAALKEAWSQAAARGAQAAVHGLLTLRPDRVEADMHLYDLTAPDQPLIASKKFAGAVGQPRRVAHKISDEVVFQFTSERGVADTKLAYVPGAQGAREIYIADYDGFDPTPVTRNGAINLSPAWSPDARSLAFTSYVQGYPDTYRVFPFERRPQQTLAAFPGINTTPAWSPDGRTLALTLSKEGNPEIYTLALATGTLRRLTRHPGIDTEPTWSPTGREIAFVSDRGGSPHIFVMDTEGANLRQITSGGFHTQPRWSPKGDTIVYTARAGAHDLWAINPDGSSPRQLTSGAGSNQSGSWSPDGRHLAFQSNRLGPWQIFAMLADGSEQILLTRGPGEHTSPSWSPRLP